MTGTTRFASLAAALLLALARTAAAQLSTAEVHQRIDMAVNSASRSGGGDSDNFKLLPTTIPVVGSGGDSIPLTSLHVSTGGTADASLFVTWHISATSISASAAFTATTTASGQDSAAAGFDQSFKISYQVSAPTSYVLTGNLRTASALDGNERLTCASNQTPLAGADPATLPAGGAVPFADEGVVHPGETATIDCSVIGGSALTDSADQRWDLTVDLTPVPATTTTLPKRQCRQACKQAKAACRATCPGTGKERRACRRDCRKRTKHCGPSTGCALP